MQEQDEQDEHRGCWAHGWRRLWPVLLLWVASACIATPLPQPPTADPGVMDVTEDGFMAVVTGGPSAISPEMPDIRVSGEPDPAGAGVPSFEEVTTGPDGSFTARVFGTRSDFFFIEALLEDTDLYLVAITGSFPTGVVTVDPPDRDGDGSPDVIDCAPDDSELLGQRCP